MSAGAPRALRRVLELRARIAAQVRAFFAGRDVIEVDTPLLYPHAPPDPHQRCLTAHDPAGARRGFLQPSPEFALKRLLAGGAPSLYQLGKAFRADEAGPRHRSEFALLEWYRVGWDYRALMDETAALGLAAVALDEALLAAVETLPACAGVALGFDRLVMLAAGADSIADVLPLDVDAPGGPVPASRGTPAS